MNARLPMSLLLSLVAGIAVADEERPAVPPEILSCASISRSPERLACYDRAIAALTSGNAATLATPESTFGVLSSTRAIESRDKDGREDLQSVSSTVTGFGRADDGSLVVVLENGQSWKQISGSDPLLRKGDTVTINRAALGSFQMVMPSGRSAKVRRVK